MSNGMRAAMYARISTADQHSLQAQVDAMKDYIRRRGWTIVAEVQEIASGNKKRDLRDELLARARRREIDCIVVWKLDRWGRSVMDLIVSLNELQEIGVGFVSITESLDLTTSVGRAMAGLLAVFAEFEHDLIRERVRAGLLHARQKGKKLGRPRTAMSKKNEIIALREKNMSIAGIARQTKIDRRSVRRVLQGTEDKKTNSEKKAYKEE